MHRILGKKFGKPEKNKENPINADLIIADEASMIDIAIFSELLDAVSEETSLILLGDKDQLASVDAGNVFSDICSCRELLPEGTVSELKTSHRFEKHPAIGRLANAVNGQKDAVEVIEICKEEQDLDFATKTLEEIVKTAKENYGFLSDTNLKPEEILKELNSFKVLCPSKEDSLGVEKLNEAIEQALTKNNASYNSRPVMITRNDYANSGLVNGDCGVILERNGKTEAWFKQNGEISSFNISELPAFETAYAMTIHKSQGSEYKSVLIILPEKDMPILTKELLYTAITRAQTHIEIASGKEVLKNTLDRSAARNSGFKEALEKLKKS
ncbi:AAA family ATPase [bacterium]|nr:AAA family ATPase [bacterium]